MRCGTCGRKLLDGEQVVAVFRVITNPERGDFVSNTGNEYIHLYHLRNEEP